MPANALNAVNADHVAPLGDIGPLLARLVREPSGGKAPPDRYLDEEFKKYLGEPSNMDRLGKPSVFACPDCGGVLWEVDDGGRGVPHFQCRDGHSYSMEGLDSDQGLHLESTLWAAIRALEESANLRRRMAERLRRRSPHLAERADQRAERSEQHAAELRELVQGESPAVRVEEGRGSA